MEMELIEFVRSRVPAGPERDLVADRFLVFRATKKKEEVWGMRFRFKFKTLWEVVSVQPSSVAEEILQIQPTDILCSVNGHAIQNMRQLVETFRQNQLTMVFFRVSQIANLVLLDDILHSMRRRMQQLQQPSSSGGILSVIQVKEEKKHDENEADEWQPWKKQKIAEDDLEEDEIEFLGCSFLLASEMPHPRSACIRYPFVPCQFRVTDCRGTPYVVSRSSNEQTCDHCYCGVCNIPAKQCMKWPFHCQLSLEIDERRAREYLHSMLEECLL